MGRDTEEELVEMRQQLKSKAKHAMNMYNSCDKSDEFDLKRTLEAFKSLPDYVINEHKVMGKAAKEVDYLYRKFRFIH